MSSKQEQKKLAMDWDREDIIAKLHKTGWSMRQLSFHHGYKYSSSLKNALDRPWPKGERLIADAIGVSAKEIWPTRFEKRQNKKVAQIRG